METVDDLSWLNGKCGKTRSEAELEDTSAWMDELEKQK